MQWIAIIPYLFIGVGLLNLFFPRTAWFWNIGWQFRNAEPSDAAVMMGRIGGLLAIGIGVFLLVAGV
ncbi:DUF6199 family natural product biosynthesis protein [Paenibacillus hodogayensis]|uniref:DUF6199 family natural product biosynthesis protein n=1 Tax=Paenibacillus hodogayensis TaxID=279208 RepID=A0ABV5W648_9BACL